MNEEQNDFLEKLVRLERDANELAQSLPPGALRSRAEHIAMVIGLLKARFNLMGPVILPTKKTTQ